MNEAETSKLFCAICKDERTKFATFGIGMARIEHLQRSATIRTPLGDELIMWLTNYPGGYTLSKADGSGYFDISETAWKFLKDAFDAGIGIRSKAKVEDVCKMLGL